MNFFLTSFEDLFSHSSFLLEAIGILLLAFILSVSSVTFQSLFKLQTKEKLHTFRNQLVSFLLLFFTTFIYLIIDTHIVPLPDPMILYGFYLLGFTILFGIRAATFASILSMILIEYYLYEPRYILFPLHHPINILYMVFVIIIGVFLGQAVRREQQKLQGENESLDLLIKARDQFSAIAVHELKTPLTTINLYSQVLNKQYKNKKASKVLQNSVQTISHETEKLNYMINDLLDFSKFQTNKFTLNTEIFSLAELCRERINIAKSLNPSQKYVFKQHVRIATICADRISLDRVLTNLLTNAGKYSSPKGKITITLQKKHREYILSVKDAGSGIAKEHLDKLFEPFYQVENGKKGLGLGLHIAKSIVELHKGKIWVESKIGKGSTFFVSLPI